MSASSDAAFGLAAYPVPGPVLSAIQSQTGPLDLVALSDLRRRPLRSILAQLSSVRGARGFVVVGDPSIEPLVPALRLLLSITRLGRLAVARGDGSVQPFSRASEIVELARLVGGAARGRAARLACHRELLALADAVPPRTVPAGWSDIAYLKTNLWAGVKVGGSVGHVAGVVNALADRARVRVLAPERPPLVRPDVMIIEIAQRSAYAYPYELNYYLYHRHFVAEAIRVLSSSPPRAIYQRMSIANYAGVALSRRFRVPLILEYNGSEVWVARHWARGLAYERTAELAEDVCLRHAHLIVTVSDALGDELAARGVARDRVLVYPNCVDPERFNPDAFTPQDRARLLGAHGIPLDATVCTFVGTFGPWHGVTLLADAIARLEQEQPEWIRRSRVHFLLVGDGALMADVRERLASASSRGLATLTGLVDQARAPAYLAASDILLSPHVPNPDGSRFFGSPTKLFEYMAMARPIVASDLEQIGQVLTPAIRVGALEREPSDAGARLAVLTEPGSREQLVRGIRLLAEHPEIRSAMGRNARARVLERYTWRANIDAVLSAAAELRA